LEEGTISTQDSVQDLKLESDDLASKLAKAERNVEKCRDEIIRLRTEAKDLRVELQTLASETAQVKTSTNAAIGFDFNTMQTDVREFTQQVRVIATNLHALTGRVKTVELHAVENVDSNFTELHKDQLEKLAFELYDLCGLFPKLEHDLNSLQVLRGCDKLLPLPQPPVRARTDARTNPSAQRATQLRRVLARVYAVSIQNQITTTVP
jgi:chromosome segregation ATPase